MIVMADSGLYSYTNFKMVLDAGADALFRVGANVELPVLEWFPDGSYLSFIADSKEKARNSYRLRRGLAKITGLPGFYVRAVDYEITDRGDGEEIITLVTNITDPDEIPAAELAAAYHQRWEAELVFDELKTHRRGAGIILRSRKPELVEQEIWGLLLTHYGIRHLMREAADQAELDPDRMSFIRALRVVRRQVSGQAASPRKLARATLEAIEEIAERPNPARRERTCPRAVKRTQHTAFSMKRREQKDTPTTRRRRSACSILQLNSMALRSSVIIRISLAADRANRLRFPKPFRITDSGILDTPIRMMHQAAKIIVTAFPIAISSASRARSERRLSATCQPTIRREYKSMMNAV